MNTSEIKTVNKYFKKFVIENYNNIYFAKKKQQEYVNNILQRKSIHFESDWNYLMTLVEIIEHMFSVREINIAKNYCCFEFENDIRIQDKGMSKINAIYNCCFQALTELWKEELTPFEQKYVEPFDYVDLL